jgi:hypothetical protein
VMRNESFARLASQASFQQALMAGSAAQMMAQMRVE